MVGTMKDQTGGSRRSRRLHEREFKEQLIAQSLVPGASVAAIAMQGGINANLLFKWRRGYVKAKAEAVPSAATLLAVCVMADIEPKPAAQAAVALSRNARPGVIELEVAGARVRLQGVVDEAMLGSVLRALRQSEA